MAPDSLASLQKSIQHDVSLFCQPVSRHGSHTSNENGRENHVTLGSECGQGADYNAEEHLLQHKDLLVCYVVEQALLWPSCGGRGKENLANSSFEDLIMCEFACIQALLTGRLILNTNAISSNESIGTVTVEGALLVDAGLIESWACYCTFITFIYICMRK